MLSSGPGLLGTFLGTFSDFCHMLGCMNKLINIKYLTQNNGYWQYERRIPKSFLRHPYWQGKVKWKESLGLKVGYNATEVRAAWKEAHSTFEKTIGNIRARNSHGDRKQERRNKAIIHLKMFGLDPHEGSLGGANEHNEHSCKIVAVEKIRTFSGAFDDYVNWEKTHQAKSRKEGSGLRPRITMMPPKVQLQREAWLAYIEDKKINRPLLFSDLWDIYALGKGLSMSDRKNQKTQKRWESFLAFVSGKALTNQSISRGLRDWLRAQTGRNVQDQTLKRELGVIRAVLNYVRQTKALELNWVLPHIEITTEEKKRPVIPKETYLILWHLIQDETARMYQPWKEFIFTILCQSSSTMSELMRLERQDVHMNAETPHISLYTSTIRKKNGKRIVPLPFRVERVKDLLQVMDQGQPTVFPPSLVTMTNNGYQWATSESNINRQLNAYLKACGSGQKGFTTSSTRLSFKLYLDSIDANPTDILYLLGWKGAHRGDQSLKHDDRYRIESEEMFRRLEITVKRAMEFLNDKEVKVVQSVNI